MNNEKITNLNKVCEKIGNVRKKGYLSITLSEIGRELNIPTSFIRKNINVIIPKLYSMENIASCEYIDGDLQIYYI